MSELQDQLRRLPPTIIPAADSAIMDAVAVRQGASLWELMQRAGAALAEHVHQHYPAGRIVVCCGSGNNGGDGYVAAAALQRLGRSVQVYQHGQPRSDLAKRAAQHCRQHGVASDSDPLASEPQVVIDALLGAGQRPTLKPELAALCRRLNASGAPIVACDLATGYAHPDGLRPQLTVAMQCAKQENQSLTGSEIVADLGIAPSAWQAVEREVLLRFPQHRSGQHKGQQGSVLVVAGGAFAGAAEFSTRFALRSGCDLVRLHTAGDHPFPAAVMVARQPGSLVTPLAANDGTELWRQSQAVLIGPGLGRHPDSAAAAQQAYDRACEYGLPMVIDADGLDACAERIINHPAAGPALILTPHGGEARRLFGPESEDWPYLHQQARPNRLILRKGAVDFLSDGQQWQYHAGGNPRLALGGSGDSLAGLCAGLLARGCTPFSAARMALWWLAAAADVCWEASGPCYQMNDIEQQLAPSLRQGMEDSGMPWPPMSA